MHSHSSNPIKFPKELVVPFELANCSAYHVRKELGRGGMGVVYLANNIQLDRLEVLKVLNERLLDHAGAKERFLREIQAVSKLSHPNIVTPYAVLPLEKLLVFVMEYVHGMNLFDFIQKHRALPIGLACTFARQLAAGLQHAHERGLVHRDIKPTNAMVFKSDGRLQLKILDFGLAKATSEKSTTGLTQDGAMLGTPEYMAPEQFLNAANADIRADVYSLGCTLYHMLAGSAPFCGTQGEIMMAHLQHEPKTLTLMRPEIPTELATIVAKMMSKLPDKRFQVPSEVIIALEPFLDMRSKNGSQSVVESVSNTIPDIASPSRDTSVDECEPELSSSPVRETTSPTEHVQMIASLMTAPPPKRIPNRKESSGAISMLNRHWTTVLPTVCTFLFSYYWFRETVSVEKPQKTIVMEQRSAGADVVADKNREHDVGATTRSDVASPKQNADEIKLKASTFLNAGDVFTGTQTHNDSFVHAPGRKFNYSMTVLTTDKTRFTGTITKQSVKGSFKIDGTIDGQNIRWQEIGLDNSEYMGEFQGDSITVSFIGYSSRYKGKVFGEVSLRRKK